MELGGEATLYELRKVIATNEVFCFVEGEDFKDPAELLQLMYIVPLDDDNQEPFDLDDEDKRIVDLLKDVGEGGERRYRVWAGEPTAGEDDPVVRPSVQSDEYTIVVAKGRNFFLPMPVKGKGGQYPLKKKSFSVSFMPITVYVRGSVPKKES